MSASSSRPISSTEKYSRHYERQSKDDMGGLDGQPGPHRLPGAAVLAARRLSRLDRAADAGAGDWVWRCGGAGSRRSRASIIAAAAAFSASGCARSAGRPRRGRCCSPPTTSPISTSRCWARCSTASFIAKTEVAGWPLFGWLAQVAALGVRRPAGAQHGASARQHRRAARRRRGADPVSRGDERRRQPAPAVQERAVQRRRSRGDAGAVTVQPVSLAYTRLDGMPLGRALRPFFAWYGVDVAGAASVADAGSGHGSKSSSSSTRRRAWPIAARARCWRAIARSGSPAGLAGALSGRRETPEPDAVRRPALPAAADAVLRHDARPQADARRNDSASAIYRLTNGAS